MTYIGRSREVASTHLAAAEAPGQSMPAGEAAVALARERPSARGEVSSALERARRVAEDASAAAGAAVKLQMLADPECVMMIAQSMLRDLHCTMRAEDAETAGQRAEIDLEDRIEADIAAREAERARAEEQDIAMVFQAIGSALALAAGAVGAAFTGGATLVGAIGLAIAVLGPLACTIATRCGGDAGIAAGVAAGCAVIGSIMSFGAGAAGGAAGAAGAAASVAAAVDASVTTLRVGSAVAQATQGGFQIAAAVHGGEAGQRRADSAQAAGDRERETEEMAAAAADFGEIMRLFARVSEKMSAVRDARAECLRIAAGARG